jgi:chromosome segregation protein
MRLKSIKLAGFKSFVDPTTVNFPSNLCAVVGPNGCGKSNIIDAVRWVMGESSAKQLRGENMTDVIFNGSGNRKPIGQASIELIFDNSDGTIVGEYAGYSEISVRRKVTRDNENSYYLNGQKCRRKDITDIFLGTGLGARSYAIIEQGMISNLIEAKPEDLRHTIEEAAGISKYKERRRDTENRIHRTLENLERLADIREELQRQLSRLERQSKAAEKYSQYKKEERWLKAQQLTLQILDLEEKAASNKSTITELELKIEALVTERVSFDTSIEKLRTLHTELNDKFNEVQGRFYAAGAEINRVEQAIQHAQERDQELRRDLHITEHDLEEAQTNLSSDTSKAESWQAELLEIEPELTDVKAEEVSSTEILLEAEDAMQNWQNEWDNFNQRANVPQQNAEVQQSRIQHIEQVQVRLLERIEKLTREQEGLGEQVNDDVSELEAEVARLQEVLAQKRTEQESCVAEAEQKRSSEQDKQSQLNQLNSELQQMRGRKASLEALQQAATAESSQAVRNWLQQHGLTDKPRLAQQIQVQSGWDLAVETVLGDTLQAICVDQLDQFGDSASGIEQGSLMIVDSVQAMTPTHSLATTPLATTPLATTLASKVQSSLPVASLLAGIYCADTVIQALALRKQLSASESVISADGLWFGPNWLRVVKGKEAGFGFLERKQELENLEQSIAQKEEVIETLAAEREEIKNQLRELEQRQKSLRETIDNDGKQLNQLQSELSAQVVRVEESASRHQRLAKDIADAKTQMGSESESLTQARTILNESIGEMEVNKVEREGLMNRRDQFRATLDQARQKARHDKDRSHELALRYQSVKTQLNSVREGIARLEQQTQRLTERRRSLQTGIEELVEPLAKNRQELSTLLEKRLGVETELSEARSAMEGVDHELRDTEQSRDSVANKIQAEREVLEHARIEAQTYLVQRQNSEQQLAQDKYTVEAVKAEMSDEVSLEFIVAELEKMANRITRLGPINLAAIDEYKIEGERLSYLNAQNEDLQEALTTLQEAIRKIDHETRTRFKDTFEQVNAGLQELFPKVFGGGNAYLELTGDDLLDTGIAIMARPPGKRNSTIHLLSGGEKALTAIALVFSIFRLNPAPFCMLDEVDAPLDDINVGRYASLVAEMSKNVQFIYITHNKISMEIAEQLMGVTMHEPGVSRLVTVDVEEAAQLAAV